MSRTYPNIGPQVFYSVMRTLDQLGPMRDILNELIIHPSYLTVIRRGNKDNQWSEILVNAWSPADQCYLVHSSIHPIADHQHAKKLARRLGSTFGMEVEEV